MRSSLLSSLLSSLRGRLLATYLGLIVIGFGGLTLLSGWQIANSAYTDFAATLRVNAALLASSLGTPGREEHGEHDEGGKAAPQLDDDLFQRTADSVNGRALLLDEDGRIRVDSATEQGTVGQKTPFAFTQATLDAPYT